MPKAPPRPAATAPERPAAKPTERPAPEPLARAARPIVPTPAQRAPATPAPDKDWGLAPPKRGASLTRWLVAGLLLLGAGAGGYYCYTEYYEPADAPSTTAREATDGEENESPPAVADEPPADDDDPFSEPPPATRKAKKTASAPRLAQHTTDAIPIQNATKQTAGTRTKKGHPLADDTASELELPTELDQPADNAPEQETEKIDDDGSKLPLLRVPQQPDDGHAVPTKSSGRKISRNTPDSDDESLSDYELADDRPSARRTSSGKGPTITTVEGQGDRAPAEQLDEYELVDGNRRRAVGRTMIVRSENAPAVASPTDDDHEWVADRTRTASRGPASRSARTDATAPTKIQPRGANSAAPGTAPRELRPAAAAPARGETYTIVPNDNFWMISRKQYGSGRYYAALARHNQERVPDPQRLRPGMQVSTPPAALLEERYPELIDKSVASPAPAAAQVAPGDGRPRFSAPASVPVTAEKPTIGQATGYFYSKTGEPMYRIGADDTLSSIAQRHLGRSTRWVEIYEQNQEILKNPESLPLGTVIRLPADASRVGLAPEVERRR